MTRQTYVYIIKPVGMDGPVKIGWSFMPQDRLQFLSAWSPFPLELVAKFPGTMALEQNIHACLWASHSHREWFKPTEEVLAFVRKISAGVPIEQAIDLNSRHGRSRHLTVKSWPAGLRLKMSYGARIRWAVAREEKRRGVRLWVPSHINSLVEGLRSKGGDDPAAVARLDEFLRNPAPHCQTEDERFPPRIGAAA